jgi:hypothetical protein
MVLTMKREKKSMMNKTTGMKKRKMKIKTKMDRMELIQLMMRRKRSQLLMTTMMMIRRMVHQWMI